MTSACGAQGQLPQGVCPVVGRARPLILSSGTVQHPLSRAGRRVASGGKPCSAAGRCPRARAWSIRLASCPAFSLCVEQAWKGTCRPHWGDENLKISNGLSWHMGGGGKFTDPQLSFTQSSSTEKCRRNHRRWKIATLLIGSGRNHQYMQTQETRS